MIIISNERIIMFPFNSVNKDRLYDAEDFAADRLLFFGDGVFPNPSNNLKAESLTSNMILTIKAGAGFIRGHTYVQKDDLYLTLEPSHALYNRKDIIVLRLDEPNRTIGIALKTGTAQTTPAAPVMQRDSDVYELKLAEITISRGVIQITAANITDTRLNNAVCGVVHGAIDQVDTTELFNQYKNYLDIQTALWDSIRNAQESAWQNQTNTQQTAWQTQTAAQQSGYESQSALINGWFSGVKNDITKLQSYDFDNLAALNGVEKTTSFSGINITETIINRYNRKKIAERISSLNTGSGIKDTTRVYASDGETVIKEANGTLVIGSDGRIQETVNGYDDYNAFSTNTSETGTATVTNTQTFPFNNSGYTVALQKTRDTTDYFVQLELVSTIGGAAGVISVSNKLKNGFMLSYSGSASQITVRYNVTGGAYNGTGGGA